ncbi:hypothetical protein K491DRAFT_691093, partial [Lophiostoma macrostomum CBS 122681]
MSYLKDRYACPLPCLLAHTSRSRPTSSYVALFHEIPYTRRPRETTVRNRTKRSTMTAFAITDRFGNVSGSWKDESTDSTDKVRYSSRAVQGGTMSDLAPPPYTEASSMDDNAGLRFGTPSPMTQIHPTAGSYPLLTQVASINDGIRRTLWRAFLVEIMAVTFSAEFQQLQAAITQSGSLGPPAVCMSDGGSSSILTERYRAALGEMCALVRDVEEKLRCGRRLAVRQHDKHLLSKLVMDPAARMQIDTAYVLEFLGRYRCFEDGGRVKTTTMLDHWTPSYLRIRPRCTAPVLDLADTLTSHATFIASLRLPEEVDIVLDNAMDRFRREKGLKGLRNSKELLYGLRDLSYYGPCCWPLSDGYMDL